MDAASTLVVEALGDAGAGGLLTLKEQAALAMAQMVVRRDVRMMDGLW